jgi:hypothetical protein
MVSTGDVLLGVLLGTIGLRGAYKLLGTVRAYLAVRGATLDSAPALDDGAQVAVEGTVFVEEPAVAADRIFGDGSEIGGYLWRAGFTDNGRYTYDSDRGEFRQGRNTFASGVEVGRMGVTTGGREVYVDLSWLAEAYDAPALSDLEVGDPKSNTSLPSVLTRYVWNSSYVDLSGTIGECSAGRLLDVLDLYRDDVETDDFRIDGRGVPAGGRLFVRGEVRIVEGTPTVTGTDTTPLVVSDRGREGFLRGLLWWSPLYAAVTVVSAGSIAWLAL